MHPLCKSAFHNLAILAALLTFDPRSFPHQSMTRVDSRPQVGRCLIQLPVAAWLSYELLKLLLATPPGYLLPALPAAKVTPLEVPSVSLLAFTNSFICCSNVFSANPLQAAS